MQKAGFLTTRLILLSIGSHDVNAVGGTEKRQRHIFLSIVKDKLTIQLVAHGRLRDLYHGSVWAMKSAKKKKKVVKMCAIATPVP